MTGLHINLIQTDSSLPDQAVHLGTKVFARPAQEGGTPSLRMSTIVVMNSHQRRYAPAPASSFPWRPAVGTAACLALAGGLLVAGPVIAAPTSTADSAAAATQDVQSRAKKKKPKSTTARGKVAGGAGMRLIAVDQQGRAKVQVLPSSGAFNIPISDGTSLHLTTQTGDYYGPVMLRGNGPVKGRAKKKKGKAAGQTNGTLNYAFLKPGKAKSVNLAVVRLRGGWAAPVKPVNAKLVDVSAGGSSVAVAGKPIGAGSSGRVAVAEGQLRNANNSPATDLDRDGIIGAFDVDDNGNLILDNLDRATRRGSVRNAPPGGGLGSEGFRMFSNYKATDPNFTDVINANVAVPSTSDLDQSTRTKLGLAVQVIPGATLGCTGQVYCPGSPIPITAGSSGDFQWHLADTYPALAAADVSAGDTFVETAPDGQGYPGVLNFVFRTTPALAAYQVLNADGTPADVNGDGLPDAAVNVDYAAGAPAGSTNSKINVSGSQKVRLVFWRPQRQAFSGETGGTGGYVDIGGLSYMADAPNLGAGGCPATAGDANGTTTPDGTWTNVQDNLGDEPTDAGRTLSMIVDAGQCAVNGGRSTADPGQSQFDLDIQAKSLFGDNAAQKVYFNLVP